jgi:predicted metal-dependent hydrolase
LEFQTTLIDPVFMPSYTIRLLPDAMNDIEEIYHYIAFVVREARTADKYVNGIMEKITVLAYVADCFAPHPRKYIQVKYGPDARTITYKKVTIIYTIQDDHVFIRRVIASSLILQKMQPPATPLITLPKEKELRISAKQYLPAEMQRLAQHHGFHYQQVKIRKSKTRWGSCSSKGIINLSFYLMLLPSHLIEYVLLHELCHTVEMNHSAAFWSLLDSHTHQRAKLLRKELRRYHIYR